MTLTKQQLAQIEAEAYVKFPENIDSEWEPNEDGSYDAKDWNQEQRDEWMEERIWVLENIEWDYNPDRPLNIGESVYDARGEYEGKEYRAIVTMCCGEVVDVEGVEEIQTQTI